MDVRTYRKIHRWLGLVVGVQLLLWTAGGLFFSLNPIAKVRGETEEPESLPLEFGTPPASPAAALTELVRLHSKADILTVALSPHLGRAIYEITFLENGEPHWALAEVSTGEL